ncbi:MAG: hypothetical protein DRQ78_08300 [Epsilonproteobacteria bacterium]|nr:MAG: hypothetical protein DRQ78_08300 [Campylobacterota bacterium]
MSIYNKDKQEAIKLAEDILKLQDLDLYQRVISDAYMRDMGHSIAMSFEASPDDIDALKAISHLNKWLTNKIEEAKILKK